MPRRFSEWKAACEIGSRIASERYCLTYLVKHHLAFEAFELNTDFPRDPLANAGRPCFAKCCLARE
jgi:hypothetical protein